MTDFTPLRARLTPREVWRSLDALADTPEFRRFLGREFPPPGPQRRRFLQLMAASFALAGCGERGDGRDQEVPYVRAPEGVPPGASLSYASATLIDGFANGALVTAINGRPIKIEGNPQHPWSRGGSDVFAQASILGLYDPQRSQAVRYLSRFSQWQSFHETMATRFWELRTRQGAGLRLLTGPVTSPSLIAQILAMQRAFPRMQWHSHVPVDRSDLYAAASRVFGRPLETRWRFDQARLVVSLGGDFLDPGPLQIGVAREWSTARRISAKTGSLLTLHSAAAVPNLTSAKADDAIVVRPAELAALAEGLLHGDTGGTWQSRVAAALHAAPGQSIVVAGSTQPTPVQEAAHRLNAQLGNIGHTVFYTAPVLPQTETLAALTEAMDRGEVEVLVMLDTNPAYDAPADLRFADRLQKVKLKIHAGLYADETAAYSDWHLPLAHPLETWGDARSADGTISLIQPTVMPFYGSRSAPEILSLLTDPQPADGRALLQAHYRTAGEDDAAFTARWHQALRDGFLPDTAFPEATVTASPAQTTAPQPSTGLDILFQPDPTVWDGSLANNGWLQETPKPLTKLVWDNAISVAPILAEREQLAAGDRVALEVAGRTVEGAIWIMPGQADSTVALSLGYGRPAPDMLYSGTGYDAYQVRSAASPWQLTGGTLRRLGTQLPLATTQTHNTMEGHDLIRIQELGAAPVGDPARAQPSLYPPAPKGDGRAWGMVINVDACIGCNACVTACQAENNIAVVGREQVMEGREMHWLRIDRYYQGSLDAPATHFMPVPCMHCEDAPCELGCPVEATLHDSEGLNLQVYNRCIGTRACSSYCPYKVRHFNYLDYSAGAAPAIQAGRNPDVTVRARGVMEKCTYCVQRIAAARITADKTNAPIADGAVQTACQGACPTQAITFGDLADPASAVKAAREDPHNYALLGELNLRPRTTYLARLAPPPSAEG